MDENIKYLLGAFLLLVVAWVATGGPQREIARQGVFIHPLAPINTGTAYGGSYLNPTPDFGGSKLKTPEKSINADILVKGAESIAEKLKKAQNLNVPSLFLKTIVFDGIAGARSSEPEKEYIRLKASDRNRRDVTISGLTLKSAITESSLVIGQGVKTLVTGKVSAQESIALVPGQTAIISTGRSPVGVSFRENICSGYLGQFQNFTPELRKQCPDGADELSRAGLASDITCAAFVAGIPRCEAYTGVIPSGLSNQCKSFVQKNLTYNGCVMTHENDSNFIGYGWRVFLGKTKELWRSDTEMIRLMDSNGNNVDALVY